MNNQIKVHETAEEWVRKAIEKGYTSRNLKEILLKNKYRPNEIVNILSIYESLKDIPKRQVQKKQETKKEQAVKTLAKKFDDKLSVNILDREKGEKGKVVNEYDLILDGAKIKISIEKIESGLTYNLYIPKVNVGTEALLDQIRKELISVTAMGVGEIVDEKSITRIKGRFMIDASKLLQQKIPKMKKETQEFLTGMLMQDMLGLGKIEFMINDPQLEEIVIINSKEIRVYHKKFGWLQTNVTLNSEDEVTNYANIIARRVGRQISVLTPLLDAHVVTGDRANAVLYPIATKGNTITIRKFSRDPWTIIDLIENKTVNKEIAATLWLAIEYEMNVLFSGGTASGKTVFLNACMPFIPPNQRIISMEDTRELMLPKFLYWCPLVTRSPNAEGKGEVSMLDLLVNSLRMRPDRIVLGEMRRQREAEVLFEAMHTGHSVYATVHADTANETIRRLTNPPINIPPSMLSNVHLNAVMFRDRRRGFRRVLQLGEFLPGKDNFTANLLYRWMPEKDQFTAHNKSLSFFENLSRNTGMDEREINKELLYKRNIFDWLIKNKIRDLESFGKVMNYYYTDKDELDAIIKSNQVKKVIEEKKDSTL